MDMMDHGVGESLASLVLRARLIVRLRFSAGGVGGPRVHSSRIASTSAFSAAKFRSAVAAGDGSPSAMAAGDCSGPGGGGSDGSSVVGMARALLTGTPGRARGFAEAAVDGSSSLSLVSRLMDGDDDFFATQNVSPRLQKEDTVDNRSGFSASLSAASNEWTPRR